MFGEKWPKIGHFLFFILKVLLFNFPKNNMKGELMWYLTAHCKFQQNSSSWVIAQDAVSTDQILGFY